MFDLILHWILKMYPPLSPRLSAVAKHICEAGGWNVSNLRLQKLLYIAHMVYLGRYRKPLIEEGFEAWMYGPVVPQLYHKMKVYGASPVSDRFYAAEKLPAEIVDVLNDVCGAFQSKSDAALVAATHADNGAWAHYYSGERSVPIPNEDILNEYRLRTRQ